MVGVVVVVVVVVVGLEEGGGETSNPYQPVAFQTRRPVVWKVRSGLVG